ncbi:MAG: hypothetical protein IKQ40_06075 [Lachnospiraceae bacterium]|nr:hypothetical protein [Lachnospiraceae bacterium]
MDIRKNRLVFNRGTLFRTLLFIFDVLVINLAYYVAILMRFSDADSFHRVGEKFMTKFWKFSPWYTLACIVLFLVFRLYSGVWRYAGFNDFKKLILVNICCCAFYVCFSMIIVGRMPITVYSIGAFLQFFMMCIARLAPRYILDSYGRSKGAKKGEVAIPLMIVGIGENTRIIQSKIERDRTNIVRPVCVIDYDYGLRGKTFNGLPVFGGLDGVKESIDKYDIKCVVIADNGLPMEFIENIRQICDRSGIELRDFMIGTEYRAGRVDIRALLDAAISPVVIERDGEDDKRFENGREALRAFRQGGLVDKVSVTDGLLRIRMESEHGHATSAGEDWIEKYREETGSDVSFF